MSHADAMAPPAAARADRGDGRTPEPEAAWAAWVPDVEHPWNAALAGHLLRRAGFGPSPSELDAALAAGPEEAVAALLRPAADVGAFNREQDAFETNGAAALSHQELRACWLRRMTLTPHPLLELMTLFWHGYFGVAADSADLALAHVRTLRAHALGRFDELLAAVLRDPAARLGAGGAENYRARPNKAFARRVLACFGVGEDAFTAGDVADTARAFTGEFIRGGVVRSLSRERDGGTKTILGQTGAWTSADVPGLVLRHPATARRIVRALYRRFVSEAEEPAAGLLEPLVREFARDFDVAKTVGRILRSRLFYSPTAVRRRVKSPAELAVGLCRAFGAVVPAIELARDVAELGQDLYRPPTLAGWAGGRAWIDPATMIGRANLAAALFAGSGRYAAGLDPAAALPDKRTSGRQEEDARSLERTLLPDGVSAGLREALASRAKRAGTAPVALRGMARLIASSPEYQLS